MTPRLNATEHERLRRELRSQIAASRHRLERDVRQMRTAGRELTNWQTYVRNYPGPTLLAAFGIGLALAAGFSQRSLRRVVGRRAMSAALGMVGARVWQDLLATFLRPGP